MCACGTQQKVHTRRPFVGVCLCAALLWLFLDFGSDQCVRACVGRGACERAKSALMCVCMLCDTS